MQMKIFVALHALVLLLSVVAKETYAPPVEPPLASAYTVMIYMNGSDLESEFGAATDDLVEMIDSGLDSQNANVLILTGGAHRWQSGAIPETECIIWRLADGSLFELESMGMVNMGEPDTLRDFIQFCRDEFPAEKYGLIMWDHGGGSIAGFGHDENFYDDALTLADMEKAFREAGLGDERLEFLGFDACFMATVEMAVLARDFARVMIASEDLEPGEGWDYHFLAALNEEICGFALGEIIVDTFFDYYVRRELYDEEVLTLSVVDLEKVAEVMDALGRIVPQELTAQKFRTMATRRAETKTFGECSPRDNYADMVDIGDMAHRLADLFPREAKAVHYALKNCVTYNRHNLGTEVYGLSAFYIYGGKSQGISSLRTYSALEADENYTRFLHQFFEELLQTRESESIHTEVVIWAAAAAKPLFTDGICREPHVPSGPEVYRMMSLIQPPFDDASLLPKMCGEYVALFPIGETKNARRFAVPAEVNGREAEIIVHISGDRKLHPASRERVASDTHPRCRVLGIRYTSPGTFQKGHAPLVAGDVLAFWQVEYDFASGVESWVKTSAITLDAPPEITWHEPPPHFLSGFRHTDLCRNVFYTAPARNVRINSDINAAHSSSRTPEITSHW